jgi:TP901 family phage tail tape measure protein
MRRQQQLDAQRAAEEAERIAQKKFQEQLRLQQVRAAELRKSLASRIPGGEATLTRLEADAARRGFAPNEMNKVFTRADSGVTDVQYRQKDPSGAIRTAEYTVNKAGEFINKTNRRLLEFGPAVMRNTLEFMKWSAAVSLVLIPLQKLKEITSAVVEQQDKLVNVMIALGGSQKNVNSVYTESYKIAQKVSEEVGGVIDAFTLAYRATGNISSETERFATATNLLTNALTLSKLAGIDEATAIDTLAASLKQMNMSLSDGSQLLDKWVRTTQIANVDLNTLASTFATVGDLSESAGISEEELMGITANLAETSMATGRELATMTKAVISGFQSDQAVKVLGEYGIALESLSGDATNFTEIMTRLNYMVNSGMLTPEQFSNITLKLGGGTRRQAVVSTFIKKYDRVNEVADQLTGDQALGAAAEALALKQETVVSATTRLNNALMNLGTTMGTKGGLLDYFSMFLNILTGIADALNSVFSLTGKVTPMLLAVGGVAAVSATKSPYARQMASLQSTARLGNMFGAFGVGSQFGNQQILGPINQGGSPDDLYLSNMYAQSMAQKLTRTNRLGFSGIGALGALGITGASLIGNQLDTSSTDLQRKSRSTADVAGGLAGAIVGTLTGAGPVIGSAIGIAISEAFVNATVARDMDFQAMFSGLTVLENGVPVGGTGVSVEDSQRTAMEAARKAVGNESGGLGTEVMATLVKTMLKDYDSEDVRKAVSKYGGSGGVIGNVTDVIASIFSDAEKAAGSTNISGKDIKIDNNQMILYILKIMRPDLYKSLSDLNIETNPAAEKLVPPAKLEAQKSIQTQYAELLRQLTQETNKELLDKLVAGDITSSDYKAGKVASGNFNATLSSVYATAGQGYQDATGKSPIETIRDFAEIFAYSSTEEQDAINAAVEEVDNLKEALSKLTPGTEDYNVKQLEVNTALTATVGLLGQYNLALVEQIKLLGTTDVSDYTQSDIDKVMDRAQQLTEKRYLATLPEGEEPNWDEFRQTLDKFVAELAGGNFSRQISGTKPEDLATALQEGASSGLITKKVSDIGFSSYDMTQEAFETNTAPYDRLITFLTEKFGYKANPEPSIVTFSDGTMAYMNKDWKIVQYLLSQILSTEEKQLQTNLYNFPSGMTAYVPFSAVNTTLQQGSGAGSVNNFLANLEKFMAEMEGTNLSGTEDFTGSGKTPGTATVPQIRRGKISTGVVDTQQEAITAFRRADQEAYARDFGKRVPDLSIGRTEMPTTGMDTFNQVLQGLLKFITGMAGLGGIGTLPQKSTTPGIDNTKGGASSKLNLDIKSTTYVQLDGRTIATAVSRYLGDKIIKMSNAGSSSIRQNII